MKQGRKVLAVLACLVLLVNVLLLWRFLKLNAMESYEDFLPLIQRTVGTDAPLTVFGDYDNNLNDSRLFLCYTTDGAGVPTFYAVAVEKALLAYKGHKLIVVDRGPDIYMTQWGDGEVFMIGNPDAAYIQLSRRNPAGETVQIPVTSVPFSYYWDWNEEPWRTDGGGAASYEYLFFDKSGQEMK